MSQTNEVLASREPYFAEVDLQTSDIFCGDERIPVDVNEPYIHLFGGELFVSHNRLVSATTKGMDIATFADTVQHDVAALKAAGIQNLGVHSDTHAEASSAFQFDRAEGKVGCGYAELRPAISQGIVERQDEILADAQRLFPELFVDTSDFVAAQQIIAAHKQLASQPDVIGAGRNVVRAAIAAGAKMMLVDGDHVSRVGIINTQPDTSFKSGEALAAGLAAYNHDLWASQGLVERLAPGQDLVEFERASVIDIIGTMKALGVEEIVRR